jgi:large subunit ribosomal protein L21
MYAIVRVANTQHFVKEGDVISVPLRSDAPDSPVSFDVLALGTDRGLAIGRPTLAGARVEGRVVEHARADKVTTIKFIRRETYRRRKGHRQQFTRVLVTAIQPGPAAAQSPRQEAR